MNANKAAMTQLDADISTLLTEISEARENLVMAQSSLTDDEAYLKDLTARCAARAEDWDQRAAMRRDELAALTKALEILENKVKSAEGKRAAFNDLDFLQVAEAKSARGMLQRVAASRSTASTS